MDTGFCDVAQTIKQPDGTEATLINEGVEKSSLSLEYSGVESASVDEADADEDEIVLVDPGGIFEVNPVPNYILEGDMPGEVLAPDEDEQGDLEDILPGVIPEDLVNTQPLIASQNAKVGSKEVRHSGIVAKKPVAVDLDELLRKLSIGNSQLPCLNLSPHSI